MKTVTWDEISLGKGPKFQSYCDGSLIRVFFSNTLIKLLDSHGYRSCELISESGNCLYIWSDQTYSIHNGLYRYTYRFVEDSIKEPSVPCSQPSQCCSNPNIVENIVLDKPFKVCRNCKQEVQ